MSILKKILGGNTLYYPGCLTKTIGQGLQRDWEEILRINGIDFIKLDKLEVCCGSPALSAGGKEIFKKLALKNFKIFKQHGINRIVTNCPACLFIFKKEYPKVLKEKWDIEARHALELVKNTPTSKKKNIKVTYHDPCHLGRKMGLFDKPREVIKAVGYELTEMDLTKKDSYCCGGGGGVKSNETNLANQIAQARIGQAKKTRAKVLVTSCPLCYFNLKENNLGLTVKEISEIIKNND